VPCGTNHDVSLGGKIDAAALGQQVAGDVVTPDDPGWDAARQAWNLVADQHPAVVVFAESSQDIAATVRAARNAGLRVAPQSTGHGAATLGDLGDAVLLQTSRLTQVAVEPDRCTARVQSGARWEHVVGPAAEHGLAGLHGSSGGVGVAGYTLGGGLGWLARREGLACGHVRSLEVVTADGEQRRVDADNEPDLFWALRGGGGMPAVVTAMEIGLVTLREAFAGAVMWPIEQADEVVEAYRAWTTTVPNEVTSSIKLVRFPPLPQVPDPVRGRALVVVTLAFTGTGSEGDDMVAPLRRAAAPYLDMLGVVPAPALAEIAGDPPGPVPGLGGGGLIDRFGPEEAAAFVELAGPESRSALVYLEIRHLGGALRTPCGDPGAAGAIEAEGLVYGVGMPVTPEATEAIHADLQAVDERLGPWSSHRPNLLTFEERRRGLRASFPADVAERLTGIAATYDPEGLLVANCSAD
jgi:FAD binding domain